jgi:hypothetical protein
LFPILWTALFWSTIHFGKKLRRRIGSAAACRDAKDSERQKNFDDRTQSVMAKPAYGVVAAFGHPFFPFPFTGI